MNNNELSMNIKKTTVTECMLSQKKGQTPGPPPKLDVDISPTETKEILDKSSCRILGATIQTNMTWAQHIEKDNNALLPSLHKQLGALQHLGNKIPMRCRKLIATGYIMSRVCNLMQLWGSTTDNYVRKMQTLWNKVARWTTGMPRRTRVKDLMTANDWMTVRDMISYHSLVLMWKMINLGKPRHISRLVRTDEDKKIDHHEPRLQFTSRGFRQRKSLEWNQMPDCLREEDSISILREQSRL